MCTLYTGTTQVHATKPHAPSTEIYRGSESAQLKPFSLNYSTFCRCSRLSFKFSSSLIIGGIYKRVISTFGVAYDSKASLVILLCSSQMDAFAAQKSIQITCKLHAMLSSNSSSIVLLQITYM